MHYVIDGYNLFFRLENEVNPLEAKRENFVEALNEALESLHLFATLIFDSHKAHAAIFPSKKILTALEVVFSPHGVSADEFILERLSTDKKPHLQIIVTSDRELSGRAKHLGAKTKTIESFFDMLLRREAKRAPKKDEKIQTESTHHLKRLQDVFEKKLRDEPSD